MLDGEERTLVDRVVREIFDLLITGELPLGGHVNEAALANRFSVSRGPIREAVKQLQGRGLIIKEPFLKARVVELSISDMIEIFQMREAVEGMSVRLATAVMSDAELDEMLDAFSQARSSRSALDLDVHVRIAEGCGNTRIRRLLCDELYHLLRLYRARSGNQPGRRQDAFSEHWQILRAMRARDADLAESLMRTHIGRATSSLQTLLAEEGRQAPPSANKG